MDKEDINHALNMSSLMRKAALDYVQEHGTPELKDGNHRALIGKWAEIMGIAICDTAVVIDQVTYGDGYFMRRCGAALDMALTTLAEMKSQKKAKR